MLGEYLFPAEETVVVTPYLGQVTKYRLIFQAMDIWKVRIMTIDSMQGREAECTIFDLVLADTRDGGYGFITSARRLNVGSSRSRNMFAFVCDSKLLTIKRPRSHLNDAEKQLWTRQQEQVSKHVRDMIRHYQSQRIVVQADYATFPEKQHIDMAAVDAFLAAKTCHKCGADDHIAKECQNPKPPKFGQCKICRSPNHQQAQCPRMLCKNCDGLGHGAKSCPQPRKPPTELCKSCGKDGHWAFQCRQPKAKPLGFSVPYGREKVPAGRIAKDNNVDTDQGVTRAELVAKTDTFYPVDQVLNPCTKQYRITHGYGVMREVGLQLREAMQSLVRRLKAAIVVFPGCETVNGLPRKYLVFAQCESEQTIRLLYPAGETGVMSFVAPIPDVQPTGWKYIVRPPFPNVECPGNLVFEVRRRNEDDRKIKASFKFPQAANMNTDIWAFPDTSDTAAKRLVNCANDFANVSDAYEEVQRVILANDLRDPVKTRNPFADLPPAQLASISPILDELDEDQRQAIQYVFDTKGPIACIQGPPGTGKTTVAAAIAQICWTLGINAAGYAPSNVATDQFAETIDAKCLQMGVIRFHSSNSETRAMARHAEKDMPAETRRKPAITMVGKPTSKAADSSTWASYLKCVMGFGASESPGELANPADDTEELEETEADRVFTTLVSDIASKDSAWTDKKRAKPNFKTSGLNYRCLQNAGEIEHDIPAFKPPEGTDPHADYRWLLRQIRQLKTSPENSIQPSKRPRRIWFKTPSTHPGSCENYNYLRHGWAVMDISINLTNGNIAPWRTSFYPLCEPLADRLALSCAIKYTSREHTTDKRALKELGEKKPAKELDILELVAEEQGTGRMRMM
ncbi:MAG: hypothetical protein Q9222_003558 [Ikaeria aurantiellina]